MLKIEFDRPGTNPKPGLVGRTVRLAAGVFLLYFFALNVRSFGGYLALREEWDVPRGTWWIAALLAIFILSDMLSIGFTRKLGSWPQLFFALLVVAAAVFDFLYYGSLWGPPLGFLVFLLVVYFLGYLGLSFVVAGVFATPG